MLKESFQTVIWNRVHPVKRTNALVYADMDAHAGRVCAETVVTTRAAKITTFAAVLVFTVHRASCRFRISGFLVMNHMNASLATEHDTMFYCNSYNTKSICKVYNMHTFNILHRSTYYSWLLCNCKNNY